MNSPITTKPNTSPLQENLPPATEGSIETRRVLYADLQLANYPVVKAGLEQLGVETECCGSGRRVLNALHFEYIDLVIMSSHLAEISALDVCRLVRDSSNLPILLLARNEIEAHEGLNAGTSSCMIRPIYMQALVQKVTELLAGAPSLSRMPILVRQYGDLSIDLRSMTIRRHGEQVEASPREVLLLNYLCQHIGEVVLTEDLQHYLQRLSPSPRTANINAVEQALARLSQVIEENTERPRYLFHLWQGGYQFGFRRVGI